MLVSIQYLLEAVVISWKPFSSLIYMAERKPAVLILATVHKSSCDEAILKTVKHNSQTRE